MTVSLTILRYRKRYIPFALLAMALFRLPLWRRKDISFWKLMGSGKNGTFDKKPDWQQWGILAVHSTALVVNGSDAAEGGNKNDLKALYGSFISKWTRFFNCEVWTIILEPIEGHGTWDGKKVFGDLPPRSDHEGLIAILTRATIRPGRLKNFWKNVDAVAVQMAVAKGFVASLGIGEVPWIKQATFSVWESKQDMKNFAYQLHVHKEVIQKTRSEKWYSEDMFTRFKILGATGTIRGKDPLGGKL